MTVSSETRGRKVVLPEVVGLHLRDARKVLANAGLDGVRVQYQEAYADPFQVVDQRPGSGQLVDRGREVALVVARQSLVDFLPQVYQQGAEDGAAFLKGFLYIVQHVADGIEDRIARIHEIFDPRTTDPEFLSWLAGWLAITLAPDWDEMERRKMLLAATRLFPYRGTSMAIREFVRIYSGANVTVEENVWPFSGFRIGPGSEIGQDAVILPPMNLAHCFVVRLDRPANEVREDEIIKIHRIIQAQKPAHTSYFLAFSDEGETGEMKAFFEVGLGAIGVEPEPEAPARALAATGPEQGFAAQAPTAAEWRKREREERERAIETRIRERAERRAAGEPEAPRALPRSRRVEEVEPPPVVAESAPEPSSEAAGPEAPPAASSPEPEEAATDSTADAAAGEVSEAEAKRLERARRAAERDALKKAREARAREREALRKDDEDEG